MSSILYLCSILMLLLELPKPAAPLWLNGKGETDNKYPTRCNINYQFSCRNITIKYPFKPTNTEGDFCDGYPINCPSYYGLWGWPVIKINSVQYEVKTIDYSNSTLRIVPVSIAMEIGKGGCLDPLEMSAAKYVSPFKHTEANKELVITMHTNCSRPVFTYGKAQRGESLCNSTYYAPSSNCTITSVSVPVLAQLENNSRIYELFLQGFEVSWPDAPTAVQNYGGIAAFAATVTIVVLVFSYLCYWTFFSKDKRNKNTPYAEAFLEKFGSLAPRRYSYLQIEKMTDNFKEKIGRGGFGVVYKGKLANGQPVAVKVLNSSRTSWKDFFSEIISIGCTHHINIVTLLGFCLEGFRRALIYEFLPNGSLDNFIFAKDKAASHEGRNIDCLLNIAIGIAQGLDYLHQGCNICILHFDIKPHNILLDEEYRPKIADFGLAKLYHSDKKTTSTIGARGTIGYMAPEVFSKEYGEISAKSDVYSYGMMMLEMIAGRRNTDQRQQSSSKIYFPEWIYEHIDVEGYDHLKRILGLDAKSEDKIIRRMAIVGLWCIQTRPNDRPSMSKVVAMLEGKLTCLAKPPLPSLSASPPPVREVRVSSVAHQTELVTPPSART